MIAQLFRKLDKRSLAALALTALAIAVFVLGCFASYQTLRDERQAEQRADAQRMLLAFEAHSMRLFDYADSYLRAIRAYHAEQGDSENWQRFVHEIKAPHADIFSGVVTIIDRNGWVVYQSETPRHKLKDFGQMSGLDHYQYFIKHPGDSLFVGATRLGKITGKLQFRLARPLLKDGVFDGLVVITLRPEHISDFYRSLNLGRHSSVAMLTQEAKLIARYPPPPPEMYERALFDPKLFFRIDFEKQASGSFLGYVSPVDHLRRDSYYRRLADYPVVLVVNIAEQDSEDALAGARRNLTMLALAFTLIGLFGCSQALRLIGQNRRLAEAEAASQASEARLQAIFDASPDALLITDPQGKIKMANRQVERVYGYSAAELVGQPATLLLPERQHADFPEFRARIAAMPSGLEMAAIARRKDGSEFEVEVTVNWIHTDQGLYSAAGIRDITERKAAAAALAESRNLLQNIIDTAPIRVFWKDKDLRYLGCNPLFIRDAGKTCLDEVLGKDDYQMAWIDQAERYRADDRSVMDSGIPRLAYEEPQTSADGAKLWLRTSKVPLRNRDNQIIGVLGIYEDITEQKQAENILRDSSYRLKEAQRIAQLGSWTLDLASGKLIWSDEMFLLLEIDPERFGATYEAFLNAVHPEDRNRVNQSYSELLTSPLPYDEFTHRLLMSDGRIKWVQVRCTTEFDAAGNALRCSGTVQDITERKQAEEELRIAATAFESQEAMVVTDTNEVILRVNRAFTEITGYTAEELVGRTPRLLKSDRHNAEFFHEMWESIHRTGGWRGEVWDRRKNGEVYPKWLTISAVKDQHGVVTHYIGTHYDITERKQAEEKINELAFFDQLTGLPNRTLLLDRLKQVMAASSRSGSYGALLFIDLDHFKTLNDTLGHDMGDLLLKQAAQRLTLCVREGDTVARLGGDEFVVVLAGLSANQAEAATAIETVAEKILATLDQPYQLGNLVYQSTASIGVTLFKGDLESIDNLMKQADLAMYKSKAAGRNLVHFFDPTLELAVRERAALDEDLRRAVEEQQFLLHYQAQVTGDGRLTGVEALVRWQHPERGMVSPADFIPLAEETGLILPLGHWVLRTACVQLAEWAHRPEFAHLTIAVNVSAHQFHQANFVDQVLAVLTITGANPQRLKLELTESLLVKNVQDIIEKMNALKAKGVGFSLDDFGTGYSSLTYLKRLPLDQLKIDQSFVRDVLTDPNDASIARTVVALAQGLGLGVIAEGVETEEQRDFLSSNGCHAYQGYLFSRPLPLEAFERFLLSR